MTRDSSGIKNKKDFSQKLINLIDLRNMKQYELADKIGVTPATVSKYINGIQFPHYEIIKKISDVLEVSTDYLHGKDLSEDGEKDIHTLKSILIKNNFIKNYNEELNGQQLKKLFDFYEKNKDLFKDK